jgi:arsenate reductase (glutaredoxin)
MTVYGLVNCDTTKAAIKLFKARQQNFVFHDLKTMDVSREQVEKWLQTVSLEKLLNKKSTTWRGLPVEEQLTASTIEGAVTLLVNHTNLIKRPLIEWENGTISVGFDVAEFETLVSS